MTEACTRSTAIHKAKNVCRRSVHTENYDTERNAEVYSSSELQQHGDTESDKRIAVS